jgi:electron transfer flavoprotein beta subunit
VQGAETPPPRHRHRRFRDFDRIPRRAVHRQSLGKSALEEAIRLEEKVPGSTVTVFTVGKDDAQKDLKTALAKGADEAVIVKADGPLDTFAVARLLADAIATAGGTDAVWCGKQSAEDDAAAVGPMLAATLDIPCATAYFVAFEADGTAFKAAREVEGGREEVVGAFPCVFHRGQGPEQAPAGRPRGNHGGGQEAAALEWRVRRPPPPP